MCKKKLCNLLFFNFIYPKQSIGNILIIATYIASNALQHKYVSMIPCENKNPHTGTRMSFDTNARAEDRFLCMKKN